MSRPLRLAVNRRLIDKNATGDKRLFVEGFENQSQTIDQLAEHVKQGHAFTVELSGQRRTVNFVASDVVAVDIDRGMSVEQALVHPLIAEHAAMVYTTKSHAPEAHRYRVVFVAPRTITKADEMRAAMRSLALRLNGDPSATDPARIFFGNKNAQVWTIGKEIDADLLDELIAQSINPTGNDRAAGGALAGVRSALKIKPEQVIRLAGGIMLPFSRVPPKTQVHCPFHDDVHASAHVVTSERGVHGLRCAACVRTYWPTDGVDDFDFLHFDRAVRQAREHFEQHRDWGPLGAVLNTSAAQIGLLGCNIDITDDMPAPPELLRGLTLIKAPKGSGKTESLKRLTAGADNVLLIGHRRSLIRQSCRRLGLACYLDAPTYSNRLGVCLDSLERLPLTFFYNRRYSRYNLVIIDESEQVLAHFLSDTIEQRKGGGRERLFNKFELLVRRARRVVALDADLGFVTLNTLARMMALAPPNPDQADLFEKNRPAARLWMNDGKPGQGKSVQVFRSKAHLMADLMQALAEGKRIFVTANSKALINDIAAMVAAGQPHVKQIVITADTVSREAQKAFLENAQAQAPN